MDTLIVFTLFSFFISLMSIPGIALLNFRTDYTSKDDPKNYEKYNKRGKTNRIIISALIGLVTLLNLGALLTLRILTM